MPTYTAIFVDPRVTCILPRFADSLRLITYLEVFNFIVQASFLDRKYEPEWTRECRYVDVFLNAYYAYVRYIRENVFAVRRGSKSSA